MSKQDEARSIAAEYIIEQMQQGVIPWRRDWKQHSSTGAFGSLPYNYARGNTYHGSTYRQTVGRCRQMNWAPAPPEMDRAAMQADSKNW
nr:ArdC family protein [Stenotrophomonas pavanii]